MDKWGSIDFRRGGVEEGGTEGMKGGRERTERDNVSSVLPAAQ